MDRHAGSGKCLAQWVLAISKLPVAPVRTRASADFFPTFYGTFTTHVFNAGLFLFLGRIELDPDYTCKPRRPAALHSYTCLPATQTRPVSQQRGNRSGSTPNHADHRDKELIGAPFFMMI